LGCRGSTTAAARLKHRRSGLSWPAPQDIMMDQSHPTQTLADRTPAGPAPGQCHPRGLCPKQVRPRPSWIPICCLIPACCLINAYPYLHLDASVALALPALPSPVRSELGVTAPGACRLPSPGQPTLRAVLFHSCCSNLLVHRAHPCLLASCCHSALAQAPHL